MRPVMRVLCAAILAGPTALAFASGGYFDRPRQVALVAAWALAAIAFLVADRPLARTRAGLTALAAMAAYAGWIGLSTSWAPLKGPAAGDFERAVLYTGALAAAAAAFRSRVAARAAEPALAAGTLIVTGYGLAGRLLPGLVHEHPTTAAFGRLDQPLTYWNAQGALAAMGFVLCARVAGDTSRPAALRRAAAAGAVPLAAGVYLSFSRGAVAALAAGLIVLIVAAPSRAQLRAVAGCVVAGALAAAASGVTEGVRRLGGSLHTREREGAIVLAVLGVLMGAAALAAAWSQRAEGAGEDRLALPRWTPAAATILVLALVAVPVTVARESPPGSAAGATNARFSSVGSNRYAYWKVALHAAADHPLAGVGASGFAVEWARRRTIDEPVHDAHSLEIETAAELGLVGLALLTALLGAIALAARRAHGADRRLAAGPIGALVVWAMHSAIDWDWEMPALTLVAVILAGALVARADAPLA